MLDSRFNLNLNILMIAYGSLVLALYLEILLFSCFGIKVVRDPYFPEFGLNTEIYGKKIKK